ncbi:unnamed protein product [Owenia fusiformis]|uniref:ATP synthase subunit g n=1 Tax=Owenia fusiformis TaxID=6347 RepID=A0A8J1TUY8_OWEFU|nr:unnamed protein product [Owenia fusiformis]
MAAAAQKIANWGVKTVTKVATGTASFAAPRAKTFMKYARVELRPPTPAEMGEASQSFQKLIKSAQTGKWQTVTTQEALRNSLITLEIACWFFVGEIIGRRSLVGYNIPGAVFYDEDF